VGRGEEWLGWEWKLEVSSVGGRGSAKYCATGAVVFVEVGGREMVRCDGRC
jgi:hypothetical protein